jgi:hypothetical protein
VGPNKSSGTSYKYREAVSTSRRGGAADLQWVQRLEAIGGEETAVRTGGVRGGERERMGKERRVMKGKEEN